VRKRLTAWVLLFFPRLSSLVFQERSGFKKRWG
jgi:hypothetical protein